MPAAAAPTLIAASLVNFLVYQNYPIFRWEIGLIGLVVIVLSAAAWLIYSLAPKFIRSLMEAAIIVFFIGVNTKLVYSPIIFTLVISALIFYFRISILRKVTIFGIIFLVTSSLGVGGSRSLIQENNINRAYTLKNIPPLLHIILDEHIGIGGLKYEGPDSQNLAEEIVQAYSQRGFRIYEKAYSQHFMTTYAVPNELGIVKPDKFVAGPETVSTKWLEGLIDQGYSLKIYQSDYVDYCANTKTVTCVTYSASTLQSSLDYPLNVWERSELVAWRFGMLIPGANYTVYAINRVYSILRSAPRNSLQILEPRDFTAPMGAMAGLERLAHDLQAVKPGEAFFAHLLMPHFPYVFDADCRVRPLRKWDRNLSSVPVVQRQLEYNGQVRCTLDRVMRLVDDLAARTGGRFIAIVHGDHGSRILSFNPMLEARARFTDAEMIASYSTFFAIRPMGGAASRLSRARPVPQLLQEFLNSGLARLPSDTSGTRSKVWLPDIEYKPIAEADMPASW